MPRGPVGRTTMWMSWAGVLQPNVFEAQQGSNRERARHKMAEQAKPTYPTRVRQEVSSGQLVGWSNLDWCSNSKWITLSNLRWVRSTMKDDLALTVKIEHHRTYPVCFFNLLSDYIAYFGLAGINFVIIWSRTVWSRQSKKTF